jgi:hypothetical protein
MLRSRRRPELGVLVWLPDRRNRQNLVIALLK